MRNTYDAFWGEISYYLVYNLLDHPVPSSPFQKFCTHATAKGLKHNDVAQSKAMPIERLSICVLFENYVQKLCQFFLVE